MEVLITASTQVNENKEILNVCKRMCEKCVLWWSNAFIYNQIYYRCANIIKQTCIQIDFTGSECTKYEHKEHIYFCLYVTATPSKTEVLCIHGRLNQKFYFSRICLGREMTFSSFNVSYKEKTGRNAAFNILSFGRKKSFQPQSGRITLKLTWVVKSECI